MTRGRDLRRALGRIRRSPSLFAAGGVVSWGWVAVLLAVGAATPLVESAVNLLLLASGQGRATYGGVAVPETTQTLLTAAIELALLGAALGVLWILVAVPLNAVVARLVRDEADGWLDAMGSTARDLPRLLGTGVLYRGLVALAFPIAAALALAVYLSLGTALEALGYALGLYWYVPVYVAPLAVIGCLALGRRAAATALGPPDPAVVADGERSVRSVVWTTALDALGRGRRTALDGAVEAALLATPVAVGLAVVAGVTTVELGSRAVELAAAIGSVVAFVVGGALAHSTAAVFRTYRTDRRPAGDAGAEDSPGGTPDEVPTERVEWEADDSGRERFGESVSSVRVGLLVAMVVAAGVVGGAVRYVDATPGDRQAGPPGAVSADDDPDRIVREGIAAAEHTSYTWISTSETRRLYDNGTTGEWERGLRLRLKRDRDDEQVRLVAYLGESASSLTYVDQVTFALAQFEGRNATDESAVRSADWLVYPQIPGMAYGLRGDGATTDLEVPDDGELRVADETDDRVVVASEDPETVAAFADGGFSPDRTTDASVRIELEPSTGYVRRIEVEYVRLLENEPYDQRVRRTIRFEEYGSTDVDRPPGFRRGPVSEVLDVLYY